MQENQIPMENFGNGIDFQSMLPIQFDPDTKRMTVRPRIDGRAVEDAALRFMDTAVDQQKPEELLIDLADQPTVTSSILNAFVKYHQQGIEVLLVDPSKSTMEALTHTMLIQFFHIHHRSSRDGL